MKRIKMNANDLYLLNIEYFASGRIKHPQHGNGTRYILCNTLTDIQIDTIIKFKNTLCSSCSYKYVPEIKHTTLTLFDKCI